MAKSPFYLCFLVLVALKCHGQKLPNKSTEIEPFFIDQPDNVTIVSGKKVLLKCVVGNTQGRSVQWTFDNFGLGLDRGLTDWPHLRMVGANPKSKSFLYQSIFFLFFSSYEFPGVKIIIFDLVCYF